MNNAIKNVVIIVLFLGSFALRTKGQETRSLKTLESYQKARQVLEKSIDVLGDYKTISVDWEGPLFMINQSVSSSLPMSSSMFKATLNYDSINGRLSYENDFETPGGFPSHRKMVRSEKGGFDIVYHEKIIRDLPDSSIQDVLWGLNRLPDSYLKRLLKNPTALRWIGKTTYENQLQNVIVGKIENSTVTVYIDDKTNLLTKFEYLNHDPFEGDTITEGIFSEYRKLGNVMIPMRWIEKVGGNITKNFRYKNIKLNPNLAALIWTRPDIFPIAKDAPRSETKITEVGDGVYFLEAIAFPYNMFFVEFRHFIVVIEAPVNSAISESAIKLIKEKIPNKPIKYVIPTHHHDDHAGGLRAFINEGTTILTTPKNAPLFEKMSKAIFTLAPDSLSKNMRPAKIETIKEKKHIITDGTQVFEIYDIGMSPHSEEMVIAYLPSSKLVFQGDLYNDALPNETTDHFVGWLRKSGLAVEKIYGVHSLGATLQAIEEAIKAK